MAKKKAKTELCPLSIAQLSTGELEEILQNREQMKDDLYEAVQSLQNAISEIEYLQEKVDAGEFLDVDKASAIRADAEKIYDSVS